MKWTLTLCVEIIKCGLGPASSDCSGAMADTTVLCFQSMIGKVRGEMIDKGEC